MPPVSVPMIGLVKDGRILVPLSQPVTQQTFTCLNPWHEKGANPVDIEVWSTGLKTWCPVSSNCISLDVKHTELPVLRLPRGRLCTGPPNRNTLNSMSHSAHSMALGRMPVAPMCSMKAQMYDLKYIWPKEFEHSRTHCNTLWKVDGDAISPYPNLRCIDDMWEMDGTGNELAMGLVSPPWKMQQMILDSTGDDSGEESD